MPQKKKKKNPKTSPHPCHFHNLPLPTVFTGFRICRNDVLQGGAREVSSGMSLPKAGRWARCAAEHFWMTNFMYSRELLWSCVGCWPDILQAYASEQCKFLLRRQNHVGNGPSVSGLVHSKKHRSGRRVWREAGAIRREHAHRQEMPTSAQFFDYGLSISK